jgi:N-acetylglucosaminyldiphosphoundecaprenol N-acetyl-beta-D-mannosaminyltransferase
MNTADTFAVVKCAGIPIAASTRRQAADEVLRLATEELTSGIDIHLCNAYTLALADGDGAFHSMLRQAGINFPDGMSVVWANRWRHKHLDLPRERVYGPDLFLDVLGHGQQSDVRHYLLGSTPEVLRDLRLEVERRFPRVAIVGMESPPFRPLSSAEQYDQIRRIQESKAQVVWVGLGTPKQDWHTAELARRVPAIFVAIGAAFDFVSGHKKQAPSWVQRRGLEWMFRLATEPRRLWKRYLVGNVQFIRATMRR